MNPITVAYRLSLYQIGDFESLGGEGRMEFLLTQITSKACFLFINISIQLFLF